jgi:hypothetical protein
MRNMKAGQGVVFDMYEDQSERFMDISAHLKERGSDITVDFCSELPDLEEDGMGGGNWRNNNGGGGDGGY